MARKDYGRVNRGIIAITALWLAGVLLLVASRATAATDGYRGQPATTWVGGLYKLAPSTLATGEYDTLRLDASGNLKTTGTYTPGTSTAAIGTVAISVIPPEGLTPSGVKTSNGGTAVVIVAASSGKQTFFGRLVVTNLSTSATHTVQLLETVSGTVLDQFTLSPGGNAGYGKLDCLATTISNGLSFKFTDGTGAAGDLTATAESYQQ